MNLPHSRSALESHLKFKLGLIQKSRKRNTPESSLRSIARARPSAHPAALHPLLLAAGTFGLPRHPKAWGLGAIWGCRRQPSSPKRSGLHIDCTSAASQTSGPAEAFGNFRVYAVYAVPSIKNTATPSLETCFRPSRIAASQAEIPLEAQRSPARFRKRTGEETWAERHNGHLSRPCKGRRPAWWDAYAAPCLASRSVSSSFWQQEVTPPMCCEHRNITKHSLARQMP